MSKKRNILRAAGRVMCLIGGLAGAAALSATAALAGEAAALAVGHMANFAVSEAPKPAPDGRFIDGEGREHSLSEFRGKVILLNFWATWCGPCRKEMPDIDRLQANLGGPDFQVVALSSDRQGPDVVKDFLAELDVRNLQVFNDSTAKLQRSFRAFGLPTTVILDREGRELGRLVGPADWGSAEAVALVRHFIAAGRAS